jgi:hypothetical protein
MIIAEQEGRPYVHLHGKVRKDDLAKQIAERDHIEQGLICILSVLEPCRTFSFGSKNSKPFVASARRKCLFLYFYFIQQRHLHADDDMENRPAKLSPSA